MRVADRPARRVLRLLLLLWLAPLLSRAAPGEETLVGVEAGWGGLAGLLGQNRAWVETVELRPGWRFHGIGPWGALSVLDRALYAAAGMLVNVPVTGRWRLTPSFGAGYFTHTDDFDPGYPLEFRSAIEASYGWGRGGRIGVRYAHISNASLGRRNDGIETVTLSCSIPIGARPP